MERLYYVNSRCYTMSLWILAVILFMLLHYSESDCNVQHCNPSLYCNGTRCYGCNDGYYLKYASSCIHCQQSLPGCATCSSSTSCTKCIDGYYLQSGSCIQCQLSLPDCATCNSTSCTKCNDGYYLQSGSCFLCPVRCTTCTSSTKCTTCKDTYWNVYNGCNSHCVDSCLRRRCNDTTGLCYSCIPGKYGPQCGQDCNLCKDGQCDLRKCTNGCKDGYYQETTASGYSYCFKCVYDKCITCSNGTYCTQCEQGYYRNYYRHPLSGRGTMDCMQCSDSCLDCTSTEHCHEDCIQHCSVPVTKGTTELTHKSTTHSNTVTKLPSTSNDQQTSTQSTNPLSDNQQETNQPDAMDPTVISTKPPDKPLTDSTSPSHTPIQYQLTFGHGLATGIGITILLFGSGVGIVFCIRRQKKEHKYADENSDSHHEYVNTNMTDIMSIISSENNEVTNYIHTVSSDLTNTGVTNIESSRDYVFLGDRPTHESDYTDLQNT